MVGPLTLVNFAAALTEFGKGAAMQHLNHTNTVQASQRTNSYRNYSGGIENRSHLEQANIGAAAVAMHRDNLINQKEFRRDAGKMLAS